MALNYYMAAKYQTGIVHQPVRDKNCEACHLPHGLVCAACLEPVIQFNMESVSDKYEIISVTLGDDLLKTVLRLNKVLKIKNPFKGAELSEKDLIIKETLASGSTKSNPRPVAAEDAENLLKKLFRD